MKEKRHYTANKVISYNGVFTFINTTRNLGKTWAFKRRAFKRAIKHGRKTLWVRTFKKEIKECVRKMYTSLDLQKFCGIELYDAKTKRGNFRQNGNTFYCLYNGKWIDFLQVACVSDSNALRSVDDVKLDTIVYDEYTTTPEKYRRYRGNVVQDFIDLWISAKREHVVRCFFLGNKESFINPFFTYFNIPQIPTTFSGIKSFRNGSIIVEQVNAEALSENAFDKKVNDMLAGTAYGRYLVNNEYKTQTGLKCKRTPPEAFEYIQLNINGQELRISTYNGCFYISNKIDKMRRVFVLNSLHKYKHEFLLVKKEKRLFDSFICAVADSRVFFDTFRTYEAILPFYTWLGV